MEYFKNIVIGSGPSAYSAIRGILDRGEPVSVLDIGVEIEKEKLNLKSKLKLEINSDSGPSEESMNVLRSASDVSTSGVPIKRVFTSDFPYKEYSGSIDIHRTRVQASPSYAKGGFSSVWGSSIMPFCQNEMKYWPIDLKDLDISYKKILEHIPSSIVKDDLDKEFPVFLESYESLKNSLQTENILNILDKNKKILSQNGITYGKSRLAVAAQKCIYCGLCLYGCPEDAILNTSNLIQELVQSNQIQYIPQVEVISVRETEEFLILKTRNIESGIVNEISASRVYLAAGNLSTTKIMLTSLEVYDTEIEIRDSQYFIVPFFAFKAKSNVQKEKLHSLSQFYLEVSDKKISEFNIHLQVYGYSDLLQTALKSMLKFFYPIFRPVLSIVLNRMFVIQGYVHSNNSHSILLSLKNKNGPLILKKKENKYTNGIIKRLLWKITSMSFSLGGFPFLPMLKISEPGFGNHYGCSFPMKKEPTKFESDEFARPSGFKRLHLVDSTSLPHISANTITFTVMANAYRIANINFD